MTTGWKPDPSFPEFRPLPMGAAEPVTNSITNDTLVDIAKKLERVIELLEKQLQLMQ
jgi:hypothetical protein